ncbi:MAG: acyl-CoA/acyl-ACP dehydrogenase [Deltaproteobacteria bacterium]|nr:acyl-CoA/acyl-ACP dehydrogenase [Deltaproteobacteria bacterium]
MRFALSDDQALLRSSTRDFLGSELPIEKSRAVMEHSKAGYDPAEWRRLAEMGYVGLVLPARVGGQGLGAVELAIVLEEMGRVCVPGPFLDVVLAASLVADGGVDDALVRDVVAGEKLVAIARHDAPFAGPAATTVRANGGRVRGVKYFVPFAASADALVATTVDGLVLVDGPFEATPLQTLDLAQRFGDIVLDHAAKPLGASADLVRVDRLGAVGASAMLLGLMSRCLETTLEYVRTRQAFERPIGAFQALQHRMADMLLKVESTRSAVYRAAWSFDTDAPEAPLACAAAKAYAGDSARHVCGEAIQMHGGIGFTWELDLHFYFKRAKTLEQHYGSTEAQLEAALVAAGY